jgi:hypothetical protein
LTVLIVPSFNRRVIYVLFHNGIQPLIGKAVIKCWKTRDDRKLRKTNAFESKRIIPHRKIFLIRKHESSQELYHEGKCHDYPIFGFKE